MKKIIRTVSALSLATCLPLFLLGCGQPPESPNDHAHGPGDDHSHDAAGEHAHRESAATPHGGTPVQLGGHDFHLELVHDSIDGKMLAYVFDAHMEKPVNVPTTTFEMIAKAGDHEHRLTFSATGESTSVFAAPASALANLSKFEGVIPKITLGGKTFENVSFSYPKGTRHSH